MNAFAGVLNVLAKAMGGVAAHSDNSQESGDAEQNNDPFNECDHICVLIALAYFLNRLSS